MVQNERGPGRGLSQAPPGPGWAGKRPQIGDFRSPPGKSLKTNLIALELSWVAAALHAHRFPALTDGPNCDTLRGVGSHTLPPTEFQRSGALRGPIQGPTG